MEIENKDLKNWSKENSLDLIQHSKFLFSIDNKKLLYIFPKEGKIFDEDLNLLLSKDELDVYKQGVDFCFFSFGGRFYYISADPNAKTKLKLLKYIGKATQNILPKDFNFSFLGVHGKYEVLNGSRDYSEWVEKAKFLGFESLGLCEQNTLAGTISFYKACKAKNIKPILGVTLYIETTEGKIVDCKLYAINQQGWKHLIKIVSTVNTSDNNFLSLNKDEGFLKNNAKGIVFIFGAEFPLNKKIILDFDKVFENIFYQIDTVIWSSKKRDLDFLSEIEKYLHNFSDILEPILINDSYYLDQEEFKIKKILNKISNKGFVASSKNQHFKSIEENLLLWTQLFDKKDEEIAFNFLEVALKNTNVIVEKTEFNPISEKFHLPKYNSSKVGVSSSEELFSSLIVSSLKEKGFFEKKEYLDRVDKEVKLITKGGFIDYFLILWDVVNFCEEKNILVGVGRGSAAGSLVAYLLGITKIDPLKYGLLFERFLNPGRLKSLPDIDMDFEAKKRNEVVKYLEETYGHQYFTSVGTFKNFKISQAIQDLGRLKGISAQTRNWITKSLYFKEGKDGEFEEIFLAALKDNNFKNFLQENVEIFHNIYYLLKSPKSISIHPCATIILPKYEEDIFSYIPLRKDGDNYISEWEGTHLEAAGFLKEDILSLTKLDEISLTLENIKNFRGEKIDIYQLPTQDSKVFKLFKEGNTGGVFQFGSKGLTAYCKEVKPDSLEELINMVALYRPGPIGSGAHHSYVKLKKGLKEPEYDFKLKEVTKNTYGLYIFQEQVMKAVQVLGGFSPEETDDVRRAMGKKKAEVIEPYKKQFVEGAKKQGCSEEEALKVWQKLEVFSGYGFNKSHAAAYSMIGYISQWLKCHYPLEFWASILENLQQEKQKEYLPKYLSEISRTGSIKIVPPDINISEEKFVANPEENSIYWSLKKVAQIGEVTLGEIISNRKEKGKFYSLEDFLNRTSVDRRGVTNLILSGAFDNIENIKNIRERGKLLASYYEDILLLEDNKKYLKNDVWWYVLKQKELSGLGYFDFKELIFLEAGFLLKGKIKINWKDTVVERPTILPEDIQSDFLIDKAISLGGIIKELKVRKSKKGPYCNILIDANNTLITVTFWNQEWEIYKDKLIGKEESLLLFAGVVKKYNNNNTIHIYGDNSVHIMEAEKLESPQKKKTLDIRKGDKVKTKSNKIGIIVKYPNNREIHIDIGNANIIVNKEEIIEKL